MNAVPRVSVVLIFKDAVGFLGEAVASVRAQTLAEWELLLVDDGSSDGSSAMAQDLAAASAGRIRYLDHPDHANLGMSASRNAGIAAAHAPLTCFLDADDLYLPQRLAKHVEVLERDPTIDAVQSLDLLQSANAVDPIAALPLLQPRVWRDGLVIEPPDLLIAKLASPALMIGICSLTVRRLAALAIGGFEPEFRGVYEDQAFLTKLYLRQRVGIIDAPLTVVRVTSRSSTDGIHRQAHRDDGPWQRTTRRFLAWQLDHLRGHLRGQTRQDPLLIAGVAGLERRLASLPREGLRLLCRGHAIEFVRAIMPSAALTWAMHRQRARAARSSTVLLRELERAARAVGRGWSAVPDDRRDGLRP